MYNSKHCSTVATRYYVVLSIRSVTCTDRSAPLSTIILYNTCNSVALSCVISVRRVHVVGPEPEEIDDRLSFVFIFYTITLCMYCNSCIALETFYIIIGTTVYNDDFIIHFFTGAQKKKKKKNR